MLFKRLGRYVLTGPKQTAIAAFGFALLPLMGWLSMMVVGLVTLRKGPKEGLWALVWASLPALAWGVAGYPELLLFSLLGGVVYVWLMAWLLRQSASWAWVIEISAVIAMLAVAALHIAMPDLQTWWLAKYQKALHAQSGYMLLFNVDRFNEFLQNTQLLEQIVKFATGVTLALLLASKLVLLGFSRWWQAELFNPEGLKPELYGIRMSKVATIVLVILIGLSFKQVLIAMDCLPIAIIAFVFAGLSVMHYRFQWRNTPPLWVMLFYLIFIWLSLYVMPFLVLLAISDSFMDIRQRWITNTKS